MNLVEVMVAVTILLIITLASLPSFLTWNANTLVRSSAESLQNGLRLAQSVAAQKNAAVTLRLTTDASPTASSSANGTGVNWVILDAAGALVQRKGNEGVKNVTMSVLDESGATLTGFSGDIVFNGLGSNDLGGTRQFEFNTTNADRKLRVWVTPGGRVRMCDNSRATGDVQACEK